VPLRSNFVHWGRDRLESGARRIWRSATVPPSGPAEGKARGTLGRHLQKGGGSSEGRRKRRRSARPRPRFISRSADIPSSSKPQTHYVTHACDAPLSKQPVAIHQLGSEVVCPYPTVSFMVITRHDLARHPFARHLGTPMDIVRRVKSSRSSSSISICR
jgi:hypothetical protein